VSILDDLIKWASEVSNIGDNTFDLDRSGVSTYFNVISAPESLVEFLDRMTPKQVKDLVRNAIENNVPINGNLATFSWNAFAHPKSPLLDRDFRTFLAEQQLLPPSGVVELPGSKIAISADRGRYSIFNPQKFGSVPLPGETSSADSAKRIALQRAATNVSLTAAAAGGDVEEALLRMQGGSAPKL
jgi:hypothetical protein